MRPEIENVEKVNNIRRLCGVSYDFGAVYKSGLPYM